MKIEVWSDFVCPFCFIGQAHFNEALAAFPQKDSVTVTYKSFILSPEAAYVPGQNYYDAFSAMKNMPLTRTKAMFRKVMGLGRASGILIDFDTVKNANTFDAHRLMQFAKESGKDGAFFHRVYKAHFSEGEVISDEETLLRLAADAGLEREKAKEILANDDYAGHVEEDIAAARAAGISSVPFYRINGTHFLSGAKPVEEFANALKQFKKGD